MTNQAPVDAYQPDQARGEHQIYGAPGTGKTSTLSVWIERAAQAYGSDRVLLTSFTKAAAAELAGRKLPIPPDRIATLHAHAYRAIGKPKLIETDKDLLKQWNEAHPHMALGVGSVDVDDPLADEMPQGAGAGDEVFSKYQLLRARLRDWRMFPLVRAFGEVWEDFKKQTGSIDFTDMIELAYENVYFAPGNPLVMFVDEAQDLTANEWRLVRKWGKQALHFIVAGDDDQCIYAFKGASPETFFEADLPEDRKHILKQSHRVPQIVHAMANRWIAALSKRQPKEYRPRVDRDTGQIVQGDLRWLGDATFLQVRSLLNDAEHYLNDGKSVMFLTTCAYMLGEIKKELRNRGHVFHNPYRHKRGDWNPLGKGKGVAALLAYMAPQLRGLGKVDANGEGWRTVGTNRLWTRDELLTFISELSVSQFLVRGAKKQIEGWEDEAQPFGVEYDGMLQDTLDLIKMANGDLAWFLEKTAKTNQSKYDYLCNVVTHRGHQVLTEQPRIVIGTIHSVKGGEADVVYLMPDLSRRGYDAWCNPHMRDEVIRQLYVGMTRCRDTLVICNPASEYYVKGLHRI
jgi:DNA helicase II / ATP-dependent DNA helicase PcrA